MLFKASPSPGPCSLGRESDLIWVSGPLPGLSTQLVMLQESPLRHPVPPRLPLSDLLVALRRREGPSFPDKQEGVKESPPPHKHSGVCGSGDSGGRQVYCHGARSDVENTPERLPASQAAPAWSPCFQQAQHFPVQQGLSPSLAQEAPVPGSSSAPWTDEERAGPR